MANLLLRSQNQTSYRTKLPIQWNYLGMTVISFRLHANLMTSLAGSWENLLYITDCILIADSGGWLREALGKRDQVLLWWFVWLRAFVPPPGRLAFRMCQWPQTLLYASYAYSTRVLCSQSYIWNMSKCLVINMVKVNKDNFIYTLLKHNCITRVFMDIAFNKGYSLNACSQ